MSERAGAPRARTRRALVWRWVRVGVPACVLGFGVLRLNACMNVGPKASAERIAALARAGLESDAGGAKLSYIRAGREDDPRVIYIHGTPGDAKGWGDFLVDPIGGLESIAVDRPGFGQSGPAGAVASFKAQADAIARLLVKRAGRGTILVGHSLGGPIAAWIAAEHPDLVAGLVIVAGSLDPKLEEPGLLQMIGTTALARALMPRAIDNSMGELDAAKTQTTLLAPLLAKIVCPVIVIHGTADELVPYANVQYITKMLVNARSMEVVTLKGQGHFVPWEQPGVIRRAVEGVRDGG